jgi:hypothetical protein
MSPSRGWFARLAAQATSRGREIRNPATGQAPPQRTHDLNPVQSTWLPQVTLCAALGLLSIAIADAGSLQGNSVVAPLFWLGLLLIFVPIALRILSQNVSRTERFTSVVFLGATLYIVKILQSPTTFAFFDEFIHWRTTEDILQTHHLFTYNPLLPTAAVYPGLATLTAGIVDITGLSPFIAGLLILGVVRILLCASLFLIAERVTGSSRGAAWASLIYMSNPLFLFWASYFSYENLALPMAMFVLWWLNRVRNEPGRAPLILTVVAIAAVAVTHHVVGFALTVALAAWWVAERTQRGSSVKNSRVGLMALVSGIMAIVWILSVARVAVTYLWVTNIYPAFTQAISIALGRLPLRNLYTSGGYLAPLWERVVGLSSVLVLLVATALGVLLVWLHHRSQPALLVAAAVAATYPVILLLRFVPSGEALSGRSSEYQYTALACVIAVLMTRSAWTPGIGRRLATAIRLRTETDRSAQTSGTRTGQQANGPATSAVTVRFVAISRGRVQVAVALATLVFIGGVTVGLPSNQVLPESPRAVGYPWTVPKDVVLASVWVRHHLPRDQRFAADYLDAEALATYGLEDPVSENAAWPIFFARTMDATVVHSIRSAKVHYLLWDDKLTRGLPPTPRYYFSIDEPGAGSRTHLLPAEYLAKFASAACVDRIYDSAGVQIYNVSAIANGSCNPTPASKTGRHEGSS